MADRQEYLRGLAEDYEVDLATVEILSDALGESEDYDGLITALEDYCDEDFN